MSHIAETDPTQVCSLSNSTFTCFNAALSCKKGTFVHETAGFILYSPSDLVAQRLAGDDGDVFTHSLVGVEVAAQAGVILLDDDPGGLFHRLGPDSSLRKNK